MFLAVVAAIVPACGGGSSSGGGGGSGSVINSSGGAGSNGNGGNGSYLEIYTTTGGNIEIKGGGSVNATVSIPNVQPYLGTAGATINAATTWNVGDELSATTSNVTIAATTQTGLWVKPGVTLTVKPNFALGTTIGVNSVAAGTGVYTLDAVVPAWITVGIQVSITGCANAANNGTFTVTALGASTITTTNAASVVEAANSAGVVNKITNTHLRLSFSDGVYVQGTLLVDYEDSLATGDALGINASTFALTADNVVVAPGGRILVSGRDAVAGTTGGNGGYMDIYCNNTFVNSGTIDTTGGDDDNGGNGGFIYVYASNYSAFNAGALTANGGTGLAGAGGDGGYVYLETGSYGAHNNGTMSGRGGNGTTGGGDGGAYAYLYSSSLGATTNAGTMDVSGGNATDNGNGGNAGYVGLENYSGSVRSSGPLRSRGGNGGPNGGDGGDGDYLYIYTDGTNNYWSDNYVPEGIFVSSSLETAGGNGENGGDAGYIYIENYAYGYARPVGVTLLGYSSLGTAGGDGTVDGGSINGSSYIQADYCYDYNTSEYYGGRIYNEVPLIFRGGNGLNGDGGDGGYLEIYSDMSSVDLVAGTGVINLGSVDTSGGDGGDSGGDGNDHEVYYYPPYNPGASVGITLSGAINTSGGDGATVDGGDAGSIYVDMDYTSGLPDSSKSGVTINANINGRGGNGAVNGGDADGMDAYGDYWIRIYGTVDSSGGNGTTGSGGDGYDVDMYLNDQYSSLDVDLMEILVSGSILVNGGNGGTTGGYGGDNHYSSMGRIVWNGSFRCDGGNGGTGSGGGTSHWYMYADISISISGSATTNGGSSVSGTGGDADDVEVYAKSVTTSGSLLAKGGNSTSSTGGDGGYIYLESSEGGAAVSGTSMSVQAGTGTAPGTDGEIYINGILLANPTFP